MHILPCVSVAGEVGIRVSDDAISLRAGTGIGQNNASFDASWTHNDSKDRDVLNAGLYVNGDISTGIGGPHGG